MGMRLWQKIYLATIFLFVVLLNVGMFFVFDMTYQKNISAEQKGGESEYRMISASILRNMRSLAKQERLNEAQLQSVIGTYEKYYMAQEIQLTMWKDGQCIYPGENGAAFIWDVPDGEIRIRIFSQKGERKLQVQGLLYEENGKYYLRYEKALSELDAAWGQLQKKYLLVSAGFSLGLLVILYFLLRRMMKPIQELAEAVDEMGAGNLSSRVKWRGSDDITVLGKHFNEMAEKIQDDMLRMQGEAEAKQLFVDNFAHELKSPITSIYGFAEYIQKANVPEQETRECMEFIMSESKRLLHLSYKLLDMAKIREKEIVLSEVLVHRIFDGIQVSLEKKGKECGVEVVFFCEEEKLYGNELLLQSLLYNLVHNGICACREGGIVTVTAKCIEGSVCLAVEDTGCGIPAGEMDKIAEPFYRIDKARSREEGRTGLGLSLCMQIVDLHGAEITFSSEEKKGTRVTVLFPGMNTKMAEIHGCQ